METIHKIDVEELKKSLLQRRPMKVRFKMPMLEEDAYACLLAATENEVVFRRRTFCFNEYLERQIHEMAHWLNLTIIPFRHDAMRWLWQWQEHHA